MQPPKQATNYEAGVKRAIRIAGVGILLGVMALATWHIVSPRSSPINALLTGDALPAVPRAQRPQILDAAQFSGAAAEAYRKAKERPALFERLPCYCGCYHLQGHQNLLDCFADLHAAKCELCQRTALRAAELEKQGYGAEDIKVLLDREYAPHGSSSGREEATKPLPRNP